MTAANRKYLTLESGQRHVRESQNDEVIYSVIRVGGASGKDLSIVGGKWDFAAAKLSNVAAGAASGEVLIYDQIGVAGGVAGLDGGGKVPVSQLPSAVMTYEGVWNANTNSPTLVDGTGDAGMVYRVGVAGTQDLGSGAVHYDVGDYAIYDGAIWQRSDSTDAVASINGFTGIVVLTTSDIAEGTNLYYTAARFNAAFAAKSTTDLTEGTNLYYTAARFNSAFSGKSTTDLSEGSNLYFTAARAKTAAVADAIVDGVTDVAPSQNAVFDALALKADLTAVNGTKDFVNDNAGAITIRQLVYVKANGNVDKVNAAVSNLDDFAIGIVSDASIATTGTGKIYVKPGSIVPGFSGLTPGKKVYVHDSTLGSFTQDPTTIASGHWLYCVGRALSATEVMLNQMDAVLV